MLQPCTGHGMVCLSLNEEAQGNSGHPSAVAKGLCKQVATAKYLLTTAMLCDILAVVSQLSRTFQAREVDLSVIEPAVNLAINKLQLMKSEPGEKYAYVLSALSDGKKEYRNVHIADNKDQTKQEVSNMANKFVDAICKKLRERFPEDETCILAALDKILNPRKLPVRASDLKEHGERYLKILTDHYCKPCADDDFPGVSAAPGVSYIDKSGVIQEWNDCSVMMHAERNLSLCDFCKRIISTPQYMLQYPNLVKLASVALIIPVTSVECERGFSCQNRIKSKFRARLNTVTLNALMQLAYFSNKHFCSATATDGDYLLALAKWKAKKERRLLE